MEKKSIDIWVGLFIALGLAAIAFLALQTANLASFSKAQTISVSAKFDNIGNLKVKAPVRSAGVIVGHVKSIGLDKNTFQAVVMMDLDIRYPFPKDSSAKIQTAGLLGEQFIGLEAGGDAANLANNDKIKQTQSAIVLENLIGQLIFNKASEGKADAGSAKDGAKK